MADSAKMTKQQFLDLIRIYLGEDLVLCKSDSFPVGTLIARFDENGLVVPYPKVALLPLVRKEHSERTTQWKIHDTGVSYTLSVWNTSGDVAMEKVMAVTPLHYMLVHDLCYFVEEFQIRLAKWMKKTKNCDAVQRQNLATKVVMAVCRMAIGVSGPMVLTTDATNYILDHWLPDNMRITPKSIRAKRKQLLEKLALLDELEEAIAEE